MSARCIVVLVTVQILLYELPCLAFHMSLLVIIINGGARAPTYSAISVNNDNRWFIDNLKCRINYC